MNTSQQRAVASHRRRLADRGLARYEVRGLALDKDLVRAIAKRLAANDQDAVRLRQEIAREVLHETPFAARTGKAIIDALRRSPLVGADLNFEREIVAPRDVDF